MTGIEVFTQETHTGRAVSVIAFYPVSRKQQRRADEFAAVLRVLGLYAHTKVVAR